MRFTIVLLSLLILSISCNENNTTENQEFPQTWQLVKMTGSLVDSEVTGDDMEWQETIGFNDKGEFLKSRTTDGLVVKAFGTFTMKTEGNETFYILKYKNDSPLIANCIGDFSEYLAIRDTLLVGTWNACDGPGLEYKKQAGFRILIGPIPYQTNKIGALTANWPGI